MKGPILLLKFISAPILILAFSSAWGIFACAKLAREELPKVGRMLVRVVPILGPNRVIKGWREEYSDNPPEELLGLTRRELCLILVRSVLNGHRGLSYRRLSAKPRGIKRQRWEEIIHLFKLRRWVRPMRSWDRGNPPQELNGTGRRILLEVARTEGILPTLCADGSHFAPQQHTNTHSTEVES